MAGVGDSAVRRRFEGVRSAASMVGALSVMFSLNVVLCLWSSLGTARGCALAVSSFEGALLVSSRRTRYGAALSLAVPRRSDVPQENLTVVLAANACRQTRRRPRLDSIS